MHVVGLILLAMLLCSMPLTVTYPELSLAVEEAQADDDDDDDDDREERGDDDDDAIAPRPRRAAVVRPRQAVAVRPRLELVVSTTNDQLIERIRGLGYTVLDTADVGLIGARIARLRLPAGTSLNAARAQIAALDAGAAVALNTLYLPNELTCTGGRCAALEMVQWSSACSPSPGTVLAADRPGPVIGMIDTTVNATHPSFGASSVERIAAIGAGRTPSSPVHGTAVALLLVGAPGSRTPGLLPNARVIAVEAFHRTASGADAADVFDVVRALDQLAIRDVDVVNLSFAGGANIVLEQAVRALIARGVPVAAAVGNAGRHSPPLYPAGYDDVVAVTAVDHRSQIFRLAVQGDHVDVAAPGVRLWTAASLTGGKLRSGTSFAVPFISAALAVERAGRPDATPAELQQSIEARAADLGAPGRDSVYGAGLIKLAACGE